MPCGCSSIRSTVGPTARARKRSATRTSAEPSCSCRRSAQSRAFPSWMPTRTTCATTRSTGGRTCGSTRTSWPICRLPCSPRRRKQQRMPDVPSEQASSYLEYLPAILQEGAALGQPNFLGRFLLGFEQVLTGLGDPTEPGVEEILDGVGSLAGVERYFEPGASLPDTQRTPSTFLDWLAGWVALSLRADLDELRQRDFIARAVSLYRLRGTRTGLENLIRIYTRLGPTIIELSAPFQIGVTSRIGVD